jgi:hypothetical protein
MNIPLIFHYKKSYLFWPMRLQHLSKYTIFLTLNMTILQAIW